MQTSSQGQFQSAAMQSELADAKHELLKIQEMLEMAEKVINPVSMGCVACPHIETDTCARLFDVGVVMYLQ